MALSNLKSKEKTTIPKFVTETVVPSGNFTLGHSGYDL